MKQVCLLCNRSSADGNLYCQETYCPAEMSPYVLDYGEWLGDIEIVRLIVVQRTAALYEAMHQKQRVLLKVAHPGSENRDKLKREAEFLREVQGRKERPSFLPVLLPPYAGTNLANDAYGKAMLKGHLLYFSLYEFFEGETLRDVLTKRPQLWINHVGWLMISMATAVRNLHQRGLYHLGVTPESVLVHFDEDPNVPRILLIDLGVAADAQTLQAKTEPFFVPPAYTAPEMVTNGLQAVSPASDVYGLGLTLYELLIGEPAFPHKLRSDEDVYQMVVRNGRVDMNRVEDVKAIANIALQAVQPDKNQRQQDVNAFGDQLKAYFGNVPGPKKSRWPSLNTILIVITGLLAMAFFIALAASLAA